MIHNSLLGGFLIYERVASSLNSKSLFDIAVTHGILLLDPAKVTAVQSLDLADFLATATFKNKTNIATKYHLEFLLWLSARKDISAAIRSYSFTDSSDILVVGFGTKSEFANFLKRIGAQVKPLKIEAKAKPEELERISLSRIAN